MKIEIKHRRTGAVLYAMQIANSDPNPIRTTLEKGVIAGADLRNADLYGANLDGANLRSADLDSANLRSADLHGANLSNANLRDADLHDANLRDADLRDADLFGANLDDANLFGADLDGADLGVSYGDVPIVEGLDAQILERIESGQGKLDMGNWHTCETTHCRAGWAVVLAGEAGRDLERQLGTAIAGALIYHRSTGHVPDFYDSYAGAMNDIHACARRQIKAR
jgi:hypothetical protein